VWGWLRSVIGRQHREEQTAPAPVNRGLSRDTRMQTEKVRHRQDVVERRLARLRSVDAQIPQQASRR
jgi:hypothetical protein